MYLCDHCAYVHTLTHVIPLIWVDWFSTDVVVRYQPGDVAVVYPRNPPNVVHDFLKALKVDADMAIEVERVDPGAVCLLTRT